MTELVFEAAPVTTVPTTDGQLFPVRRIFCVGKNYADHVREMGNDPADTPPVFFTKPADAIVCPTAMDPYVDYPPETHDLHYEGELVLALSSGGRDIPLAHTMRCLYGVALGSDQTRRDIQAIAREKRGPWDLAKGFDQSAVMGTIKPSHTLDEEMSFRLSVNGEEKQRGVVRNMIFSPADIISLLSRQVELKAGDLVYSGTPEGVGRINPGDKVSLRGDGLPDLDFMMRGRL